MYACICFGGFYRKFLVFAPFTVRGIKLFTLGGTKAKINLENKACARRSDVHERS